MPIVDPPYKRQPPGGYEAVYERRQAQPPKPLATYWLLGIMFGVFLLELATINVSPELFALIFPISHGWWLHPWQLITSTLSHGDFNHLFGNSIFFYFLAPNIENIVGRRRFLTLFFATGAVSGVIQVHLPAALTATTGYEFGGSVGALGASGALMAIFGVSMILMPKSKMIIFPIFIPIPLWLAGVFYVLLDVLGVFNPYDGVGNFAHLSGMLLGFAFGLKIKDDLQRRGMKLVYG